ncbi:MAG: transcriptional regulator [Myxococcales bacterium]|nr:transcriptional regulator [Myxococcales bacterium]
MSGPAGKLVVVVEDEDEIRETLKDVFEDEGYAVAVARDGGEALTLLAQIRPHVVVLDMNLPVINGDAVYAMLRTDPRLVGVPVVVSTTDPSRAPAGVPLVRKPANLKHLLDVVRRCS